MGHKKNKSMDFCRSGKSPLADPPTKTTKTNKEKAERLNSLASQYSDNEAFRAAQTKYNQKATNDETSGTVKKDKSLTDKKPSKGSLYDMDGTMEKMPTLGPKKLSTSYKREQDYDRTHTATKKATYDPKKKK